MGLVTAACGGASETTSDSDSASTTAGTDGTLGSTEASTSTPTTAGPTGPTGSESESESTTDPGLPTESDTDPTDTDPTEASTVTTDPSACEDGEEQCKESGHEVCMAGEWVPTPCPDGEFCNEQTDACEPCVCTPGETGMCVDGMNIDTCADDCSGFESQPCPIGQVCNEDACVELLCAPGSTSCVDGDTYQECNDQGTDWGDPVDCPAGDICQNGQCVSACEAAAQTKSNVGCEFWAADMSNLPPRDTYVFAVAISNPSFDKSVNIEIFDRNNNNNEQQIITDAIDPRQVKIFNLSGSHNGQQGYYTGDAGILNSGIVQGRAFRITSDLPVVATQFNPIGGASGHTTDASLLLPTHTLGADYIHLAWNRGYGAGSTLDVVATQDDTTITITPSVNTGAGSNGLPAMTQGQPTDVTINRYDYIQITVGPNNPDLSGTQISASAPVAVFGGHSCANVPTTSTTACDHVEEQIFPLETWGKDYIAARNPVRNQGNPENMVWRIIAAEDNTTINFDPPVTIGSEVTLNGGQMVQFEDTQDFAVTADDPILLAGYMIGCNGANVPGCPGDPYMVQMVSVEQYQKDYVFLVDSSYDADFAKLVRPTGSMVEVACLGVVPENRWTTIGNSGFDWATIDMNPGEANCTTGTNEATSAQGFGIYVSGQSSAASYAYPGGLALQTINPQ